MSKPVIQLPDTKDLFFPKGIPWVVMLIGHINRDLIKDMTVTTPFAVANNKLMNWYFEDTEALSDIYWKEIADCWIAYEDLMEKQAVTGTVDLLIKGIYIQLAVLGKIERTVHIHRPRLPNDTKEINLESLNSYLITYLANKPGLFIRKVLDWITKLPEKRETAAVLSALAELFK